MRDHASSVNVIALHLHAISLTASTCTYSPRNAIRHRTGALCRIAWTRPYCEQATCTMSRVATTPVATHTTTRRTAYCRRFGVSRILGRRETLPLEHCCNPCEILALGCYCCLYETLALGRYCSP